MVHMSLDLRRRGWGRDERNEPSRSPSVEFTEKKVQTLVIFFFCSAAGEGVLRISAAL